MNIALIVLHRDSLSHQYTPITIKTTAPSSQTAQLRVDESAPPQAEDGTDAALCCPCCEVEAPLELPLVTSLPLLVGWVCADADEDPDPTPLMMNPPKPVDVGSVVAGSMATVEVGVVSSTLRLASSPKVLAGASSVPEGVSV
jgi:hypothetical protein